MWGSFSKVGKGFNVNDSVWQGSNYGFVVNNIVVGAREPVWARQVSRQGRWNGMEAMCPNLSPLYQALLGASKERESSWKCETWGSKLGQPETQAPQCGMWIKVNASANKHLGRSAPIIPAVLITVLCAQWLLLITMCCSFHTLEMDWMDHKMYFKRQAICAEKRDLLYLCTKRSAFHKRGMSGMIVVGWNSD